jgi:putative membrane protein
MKRVLQLVAVAGLSLSVLGSAPLSRPAAVPDDAAILNRFDDLIGMDIACAQLAAERGHSAEVKAFARTLVSEHGVARQLARDVAAMMSVTLKPSSDGARRAEHEKTLKALRERPDAAFDVLFVRHEVEYHRDVVNLINKEWIPAAKDADLSALLVQVGPALDGHRTMAEALLQKLGPNR